jgi:tetraacyldisaccharide 4'-kinase
MGGTGKTPVTLTLAKYCIQVLGKRTTIVLRGYKRKSSGYLLVKNGKNIVADVEQSGDEAQIYAQELSDIIVICDEDRVHGASNAVDLGAEIILLDDGFQHLRIKRDLNILLINAEEGIPAVFPFGKGREPDSAMRDADILIDTNASQNNIAKVKTETRISDIFLYKSNRSEAVTTEYLKGKRILALSGIANPKRFYDLLNRFVMSILPFPLADHAEYDSSLLSRIVEKAKSENCDLIATTTKDAVKMLEAYKILLLKDPTNPQLAVVHTTVEFTSGKEIIFSAIDRLFKTHKL